MGQYEHITERDKIIWPETALIQLNISFKVFKEPDLLLLEFSK